MFKPYILTSIDGKTSYLAVDGGLVMNNPTSTAVTHVLHNNRDFPSVNGEASSSEDKKSGESQKSNLSRASVAIAEARIEVDNLAEQIVALEEVVNCGNKVEDKQFVVLTEFLMRQLLKLDSIEAEGEEKVQRKTEVRRIQNLEDKLDSLKERNHNSSFSSSSDTGSNTLSITTNWETFDSGMGSLVPPS